MDLILKGKDESTDVITDASNLLKESEGGSNSQLEHSRLMIELFGFDFWLMF